MIQAFTRGPWHVYQHFASPTPARFDVVAATRDDEVAENITIANALLIAVTPELYEYVESSAQNGCATAAALIAKARGHCPGHIARDDEPMVCRYCGTHVGEGTVDG